MAHPLAPCFRRMAGSLGDACIRPHYPRLYPFKLTLLTDAPSPTCIFRMKARPRYKSTPRVAVRVVPLYEAEIVAEVEMSTMDVLTVKLALLAPAGTNTLKGALAAPLLLERKT